MFRRPIKNTFDHGRRGLQWTHGQVLTPQALRALLRLWRVVLFPLSLVLLGSVMQGYSNGTTDSFIVAFLLLLTGFTLVSLVFPGGRSEMRAFILTYSVCVFVGGLAQCYSLAVFNDPQSTIDSFTFFREISPEPPFTTMANMSAINSPLAVLIWQQVYKMTWWLGLKFGPYTGVMFNALVMGLAGSLTVRTARELFGNDNWRLRSVGTLFAFCGLFILFGAVLIRDCFTTFFNALVFWGIVRWLVRPTLRNLIFAAVLTGVSAYAMFYLRPTALLLFGLYGCLAFLFWFVAKRLDAMRLVAVIFTLSVLLATKPYLLGYIQSSQEFQGRAMISYAEDAENSQAAADSLGMRLVVNQPLPIRMVLGSGALMVNPIPLWVNFKIGSLDNGWIKGYHGIYQMLVLPLVFTGFIVVFQMFKKERKKATPLLFLAGYLLINLAAVVATSLEQRHIAQFMPAFMILAALPDTREKKTRKALRTITMCWFVVVILVHLAWAIMKG